MDSSADLNQVKSQKLDPNTLLIQPNTQLQTPQYTTSDVNFKPSSRSKLDRMFGRLGLGSLRSGSLVLFQSAVGAGALSLPYKAKEVGIIVMIIMMIVTSSIINWVNTTLGVLAVRTRSRSYTDLILFTTGSHLLVYIYYISMTFLTMGTVSLYVKIVGELI